MWATLHGRAEGLAQLRVLPGPGRVECKMSVLVAANSLNPCGSMPEPMWRPVAQEIPQCVIG